MDLTRRGFFITASAVASSARALGSGTQGYINSWAEDRNFWGNRIDPDIFGLARTGVPIIEDLYTYQERKLGMLSPDFLYVAADLDSVDPERVFHGDDGALLFFMQHRHFRNDQQVQKWKEILTNYRDRTNLNLHYGITASVMFATWVIKTEVLSPWIGLTANAIGTWDLIVNIINDARHVKSATKMIESVDTASFLVSRIEFNPSKPEHLRLTVFFQAKEGAEAILLWARTYNRLLRFSEPPETITGWLQEG